MRETYETQAKGLRILPGHWRPHYPFEQIAWISPPWPSQDYVWLDFPEAIFTNQGLVFLSHVNPGVGSLYTDLPAVPWQTCEGGIAFERLLPNGVCFGGSVTKENDLCAGLRLYIENGTSQPLKNITLQTCLFLRACREFADYTMNNKRVHVAGHGWKSFPDARQCNGASGQYGLGWRGGPKILDWPLMLAESNRAQRLVAMTWYDDTVSVIGNSKHPCLHADPKFKDLEVGERSTIRGSIIFFEGTLDAFAAAFRPWEKPRSFR
ncbi:MAG: hypothetical protein HY706_11920 [Candidatus Hydrogenedentes bacterium]|nr:hypothetical protein [Candidatus Hydrogenedentota bacterium]